MEEFVKYIKGEADSLSAGELTEVIDRWEWFVTPRLIRAAREGASEKRLFMHGMFHGGSCEEVSAGHIEREYNDCIIDRFLDSGDYRIDERTDEAQVAETGNFIVDDDELLTEELAEVYLQQGLFEQACEIYRRLSLLYPKKSIYFAELIERYGKGK